MSHDFRIIADIWFCFFYKVKKEEKSLLAVLTSKQRIGVKAAAGYFHLSWTLTKQG